MYSKLSAQASKIQKNKYDLESRIYFGTRRFVERMQNYATIPRYIILQLVREYQFLVEDYPENKNYVFKNDQLKAAILSLLQNAYWEFSTLKWNEPQEVIYVLFNPTWSSASEQYALAKYAVMSEALSLADQEKNRRLESRIKTIQKKDEDINLLVNKIEEKENERKEILDILSDVKSSGKILSTKITNLEKEIMELENKRFALENPDISAFTRLRFLVFICEEFRLLSTEKIANIKKFIDHPF